MRKTYRILARKPAGNRVHGRPSVHWKISQWILKKYGGVD
jgi:hypothetical protein